MSMALARKCDITGQYYDYDEYKEPEKQLKIIYKDKQLDIHPDLYDLFLHMVENNGKLPDRVLLKKVSPKHETITESEFIGDHLNGDKPKKKMGRPRKITDPEIKPPKKQAKDSQSQNRTIQLINMLSDFDVSLISENIEHKHPTFSKDSLLKLYLYKQVKGITTYHELIRSIDDEAHKLGFTELPKKRTFNDFIRNKVDKPAIAKTVDFIKKKLGFNRDKEKPPKKDTKKLKKAGRHLKITDDAVINRILELRDKHGETYRGIQTILLKEMNIHLSFKTVQNIIKREKEKKKKLKTSEEPKPASEKNDEIICPHCQSRSLAKKGFRYTENRGKIRKYLCNDCSRSFSEDSVFHRMQHNPETVNEVIKLHKQGLSSRAIVRYLSDCGVKIGHVTVCEWVKKFAGKVDEDEPTKEESEKEKNRLLKNKRSSERMKKAVVARQIQQENKCKWKEAIRLAHEKLREKKEPADELEEKKPATEEKPRKKNYYERKAEELEEKRPFYDAYMQKVKQELEDEPVESTCGWCGKKIDEGNICKECDEAFEKHQAKESL